VGGLAAGDQLPIALAQAALRLPTAGLAGRGHLLQAPWEMAPALGGIAVAPGPFAEGSAGMGVPGRGAASLAAPLARGVGRGGTPRACRSGRGGLAAGKGPESGSHRSGPGAWDAPQGLVGGDPGDEPPGLHLVCQCLGAPLEAFGGLVAGSPVCLEDALLRWRGTAYCAEPPAVGGVPGAWPGYRLACRRRHALR
jgi:hypothetical protein